MLTGSVNWSKPFKLTRSPLEGVRVEICMVLKASGCILDGFKVPGCFLNIRVNSALKYIWIRLLSIK